MEAFIEPVIFTATAITVLVMSMYEKEAYTQPGILGILYK
jgi:hypothetical protein